jgi:hypothetical protein
MEKYLSAAKSALRIINNVLGHCSTLIDQFRNDLSPWNQSFPSKSSLSVTSSPPSLLEYTDRGLSSRLEDYKIIAAELAMSSPQRLQLSSIEQSPLQPAGSGAALGLSLSVNQQPKAVLSPSTEKIYSMLSTPDLDSMLEGSPLLEDWQFLLSDFPAMLEG